MRIIRKVLVVCVLYIALATHTAIGGPQFGAGSVHSLFIKPGGSLWAMGGNYDGQLGDGMFNPTNPPVDIVPSNVVAVACGANHTLFLESDGSLRVTGNNQWGQLGDGTTEDTPNIPELIVSSGVTAVVGGYEHSLFIKSDGSLWAMGHNLWGNLGNGTYADADVPQEVVSNGVIAVSAGEQFSLFIKSDNSLWAMGDNSTGQLGDGFYQTMTNEPEEIVSSGVVAIAAGYFHSLFLKSDGSLWAMGDNSLGELGNIGTNLALIPQRIIPSGVVAIAAGEDFSLFVKNDGSLWGMGFNTYGQIGGGPSFGGSTNVPQEIVSNGVVAVAAGAFHSLFVKSDGSLWAMGNNSDGQLGDGFSASQSSTLSAVPEQIYPAPKPLLTVAASLQTNLQFQATCLFGDTYYLLGSTNIAQPLSQWTPLLTNAVLTRGTNNFTATLSNVTTTVPNQFYILRSK